MTPLSVSIAATAASLLLLVVVLELVRRRRLREKYALLWILTAIVLVVLSAWRSGVNSIGEFVGVEDSLAIIFATAFLFVIVVLLHFSTVVSGLTDRTTRLAQQNAMLEQRIRELENCLDSSSDTRD